jgi:hypothetical protein
MGAAAVPIMLGLAVGQTVYGASQASRSAKGAKKLGAFEGAMYDERALDAILRGEEEAGHVASHSRLLTGAQRASQAASGVDITSGSPADVISSDQRAAELDIATIKRNAAREAFGLREQGQFARMGGKNAAQGYQNQMYGTLISGSMDLLKIYQAYGMTRNPRSVDTSTGYQGTSGGYHSGTARY